MVIWSPPSRAGSTCVRPGRARSPRARPGPGARARPQQHRCGRAARARGAPLRRGPPAPARRRASAPRRSSSGRPARAARPRARPPRSGEGCRGGSSRRGHGRPRRRPRSGPHLQPYSCRLPTMKLTTNTQVSVDGVMQGNGAPEPGVERGGWARGPVFDDEAMAFVQQFYQRADAFLFGRRTYDLFAGYWGVRTDLEDPIVGALNTRPKYVASTTLTDPQWADTTVLSGDLAAAIGELKAKPAGELQVHGSGALTRWLLDNDLVDEINLLIVPVVVGQGARLFPDAGPDIALDLVESRAFPRGITLQIYRPNGRPQYAT